MAIRPLNRTFKHFYSPAEKSKYAMVARTQIPLMPAQAVPLYSMQGTTADPGLAAYWFFPQRCTDTIRWLIVYVMLSRPRSLATLKSVTLTKQIRDIIEQGLPMIWLPTLTSCSTTRSGRHWSWHARQPGRMASCPISFERPQQCCTACGISGIVQHWHALGWHAEPAEFMRGAAQPE